MSILFLVLIVLSSVILAFIILIQNPKGGGLSGNVGGIGNQFMGVKQTTDTLERGTWLFAGIIAVLAIFSTLFLFAVSCFQFFIYESLNYIWAQIFYLDMPD
jgi:preprotein translocase subunit SecG